VAVLRWYRDTILSKTPEGRAITQLYYEISPYMAAALREDERLASEARAMLDGFLSAAVSVRN
jgi:hypothetical protein